MSDISDTMKKMYTFIDGETNNSYEIELSAEEYAKAEVDIVFATQLLEEAKDACGPGPSHSNALTINHKITEDSSLTDDGSTLITWSDAATKCFITLYQENEKLLTCGKITHKMLWQTISAQMKQQGFDFTSKQCATKLASLKRMYKNIKDHNAKTGNNRRTWRYFELMEEVFCSKPWVTPLSTSSSRIDDDNLDISERPCKRPKMVDKLLEQLIASKNDAKEKKEKQHKEKMARLDTMNALLARLAAASESK